MSFSRRSDLSSLPSAGLPRRRARPELTDDQKTEIREAFDLFDSEKTGKLDYHELKVAMRALGFPVKKADVLQVLRDVNAESTGRVEYADFLTIMTDKFLSRDPEEELSKAFRLFDEDKTGRISLKNLRRICRELGENLSDDDLRAMIDEFDRDQDGEINEAEFMYIMKQTSTD